MLGIIAEIVDFVLKQIELLPHLSYCAFSGAHVCDRIRLALQAISSAKAALRSIIEFKPSGGAIFNSKEAAERTALGFVTRGQTHLSVKKGRWLNECTYYPRQFGR